MAEEINSATCGIDLRTYVMPVVTRSAIFASPSSLRNRKLFSRPLRITAKENTGKTQTPKVFLHRKFPRAACSCVYVIYLRYILLPCVVGPPACCSFGCGIAWGRYFRESRTPGWSNRRGSSGWVRSGSRSRSSGTRTTLRRDSEPAFWSGFWATATSDPRDQPPLAEICHTEIERSQTRAASPARA